MYLDYSFTASGSKLFHPFNIVIHPVLHELHAVSTDITGLVEQTFLCLDERFWLTKRWYVQIRENVAQMLLCHGCTNGPDRNAQHTSRFARPNVLSIRAGGMINRILEHPRN